MADANVLKFLEHFGVKGQKWGVRRPEKNSRTGKPSSPRPKASSLSDQELRAAINRMQMEKQYNDLTKTPKAKTGAIIKSVAANSAKAAVAAVATQQVNSALKKAGALK